MGKEVAQEAGQRQRRPLRLVVMSQVVVVRCRRILPPLDGARSLLGGQASARKEVAREVGDDNDDERSGSSSCLEWSYHGVGGS
jgi:hypothetical protein